MDTRRVGILTGIGAVVLGVGAYIWYKKKNKKPDVIKECKEKTKKPKAVKEENLNEAVEMHNSIMGDFLHDMVPTQKDKFIKSYMGIEELFAKHCDNADELRKADIVNFGTYLTFMMYTKNALVRDLSGDRIEAFMKLVEETTKTVYMINSHFNNDHDRFKANMYATHLTEIFNLGFENKDTLKAANF